MLRRAEVLGDKVGPVVVRISSDDEYSGMENLIARLPYGYRYAFQVDNPEWVTEEMFKAVEKHGHTIVSPCEAMAPVKTDWTYRRIAFDAGNNLGDILDGATKKNYMYMDPRNIVDPSGEIQRLREELGLKPLPDLHPNTIAPITLNTRDDVSGTGQVNPGGFTEGGSSSGRSPEDEMGGVDSGHIQKKVNWPGNREEADLVRSVDTDGPTWSEKMNSSKDGTL
jgi:hypothetical protein